MSLQTLLITMVTILQFAAPSSPAPPAISAGHSERPASRAHAYQNIQSSMGSVTWKSKRSDNGHPDCSMAPIRPKPAEDANGISVLWDICNKHDTYKVTISRLPTMRNALISENTHSNSWTDYNLLNDDGAPLYIRVDRITGLDSIEGEVVTSKPLPSPPLYGTPVSIATQNLLGMDVSANGIHSSAGRTVPPWSKRMKIHIHQIDAFQPDILLLQEAQVTNIENGKRFFDELKGRGYEYDRTIIVGDNTEKLRDGSSVSSTTRVAYKTSKYKLIRSGQFALQAHNSKGVHRSVAWVKLQNKQTGMKLYAASVHLPANISISARANETRILESRLSGLNAGNIPSFIGGDFNTNAYDTTTTNTPHSYLVNEGWEDSQAAFYRHNSGYNTYNGLNPAQKMSHKRIDYIYAKNTGSALVYNNDVFKPRQSEFSTVFASDHNMVYSVWRLPLTPSQEHYLQSQLLSLITIITSTNANVQPFYLNPSWAYRLFTFSEFQ